MTSVVSGVGDICGEFKEKKDMKKRISFILLLVVVVCSCKPNDTLETIKDQGKVITKNGKDEIDTIAFNCVGCSEYINDISVFNNIIEESRNLIKSDLNYPLSFNPSSLYLTIVKQDSMYYFDSNKKIENLFLIYSDYKYIAKNAYGNELEGKEINTFYLKDKNIIDLEGKVKLENLKFSTVINRTLTGEKHNEDFIEFTPTKDKSIIVNSSLNCVDEETLFIFILENEKEIKINSWNDFNCDGISYFNWFSKEQIETLKKSRLKYMYINSDGESVMVRIPKNQSDYIQQLMMLY